jgi:hypothetical protein
MPCHFAILQALCNQLIAEVIGSSRERRAREILHLSLNAFQHPLRVAMRLTKLLSLALALPKPTCQTETRHFSAVIECP